MIDTEARSFAARGGLAAIYAYQRTVSGLFGPRCKFHPTCSAYAAEAIAHRGLLRGVVFASWRLLRCNPCGRGGIDPAPGPSDRGASSKVRVI